MSKTPVAHPAEIQYASEELRVVPILVHLLAKAGRLGGVTTIDIKRFRELRVEKGRFFGPKILRFQQQLMGDERPFLAAIVRAISTLKALMAASKEVKEKVEASIMIDRWIWLIVKMVVNLEGLSPTFDISRSQEEWIVWALDVNLHDPTDTAFLFVKGSSYKNILNISDFDSMLGMCEIAA